MAIAGLIYLCFIRLTGFAIPCPFHLVTGLKCPGCGVTGMCIHLSKGDIPGAAAQNPFLFIMLPLLSYELIQSLRGKDRESPFLKVLIRLTALSFLIWGVVRNF